MRVNERERERVIYRRTRATLASHSCDKNFRLEGATEVRRGAQTSVRGPGLVVQQNVIFLAD